MPAVYGKFVDWTGGCFSVEVLHCPTIAIAEDRRCDLLSSVHGLCTQKIRVTKRKVFRSLGGSLSQILAIIPYVAGFCSSLHRVGNDGDGEEYVNIKCVEHDLVWIAWILTTIPRRPLRIPSFWLSESSWTIVFDASLTAFGAVLFNDLVPIIFMVASVEEVDLEPVMRGMPKPWIPGSQHQAFVEFACVNLAARVFLQEVSSQNAPRRLGIQGDSSAALYDVVKLRGKGPGMSLVGRELCLTAAQHMVLWEEVSHIPGSANWLADALSRPELLQRHAAALEHLASEGAHQVVVAARSSSFWRTRSLPDSGILPVV